LARQSEDFEGVSRAEQADSEGVDELVQEGNLCEAGAVAGVQEADDADEKEIHTRELPEDDEAIKRLLGNSTLRITFEECRKQSAVRTVFRPQQASWKKHLIWVRGSRGRPNVASKCALGFRDSGTCDHNRTLLNQKERSERVQRMAHKTNAVRLLDQMRISYELREYAVDPDDLAAETVAAKIGLPAEQVFKTLVTRGDRNGICMAVISGNAELDLKALAQATGDRSIQLVPTKELQSLTGCIGGGVTALAAKKAYPV